ncbi:MAG: hypothetical protein J0L89_08040, partial [Xanthomonadales bacterium]|nr:hypothetical protein [Xanthomonadales bacterium]
MAESPARAAVPAWLAFAVGIALAASAGFGGVVALVAGILAQPVLALAASWWRGTRAAAAGLAGVA